MMIKCESCSKSFQKPSGLFDHIQSSCLPFYKSNPQCWAKILSMLGSDKEEKAESKETPTPRTRQRSAPESSKVGTVSKKSESAESPPLKSRKQTAPSASNTNTKVMPYVCKCEASFKLLDDFKDHLKVCTPGKEPPFCIMFRAQDVDSGKPLKNIHMTVNDYFYGSLPGKILKMRKITKRCNCYSCGKTLRNNIRFMSHLRHKIFNEWEKKETTDMRNVCQHCYRQYGSPFQLQCHVENVHGSVPAACSCRICELHFTSERAFLFHMKDKHVINETPYICKVCNYQSSFYSDVIKHFRDRHTDTAALMCPFCLLVSYNHHSFLKHVLQHKKKGAECQRCRLLFLTAKERASHQQSDHSSVIIKEKLKKYRNLSKCQIYVRVTSFQNTQKQQMMQKSTEKLENTNKSLKRSSIDTMDSSEEMQEHSPKKKSFIAPAVDLPAYLCPLKRPQRVRRVRIPASGAFLSSALSCSECCETLQKTSRGITDHFRNLHECRWCVYVTSCEKASYTHVLREHASAETREGLLGKSETDDNSFFAISVDDDDEESPSPNTAKIKDEPSEPDIGKDLVPQQTETEENKKQPTETENSSSAPSNTKTRRKQSNPMKIADMTNENESDFLLKSAKKEKMVQTKTFEKEKGIQTSDSDFITAPVGGGNDEIPALQCKKPELKVKRSRKILAPEGYFPDIDDDEGWAKYFKKVEGLTYNERRFSEYKVPTPTVRSSALPTMVPRTTPMMKATSLTAPENVPAPQLSAKALCLNNKVIVTSKGITHVTQSSSLTSGVSKFIGKAPPATTGVTTTTTSAKKPVFQFQLVQPKVPDVLKQPPPVITPQRSLKPLIGVVNQVQSFNLVPQAPAKLRCLEVTHSSLLIQWDVPVNSIITQFKVVFQGSGAPTMQILPPQQTLVRLVGLKSCTMYVVRVYSLFHKTASQYAFLYQKTNKLPRGNTITSSDDVVLVVDDETPVQQSVPARATISKTVQATSTPINPQQAIPTTRQEKEKSSSLQAQLSTPTTTKKTATPLQGQLLAPATTKETATPLQGQLLTPATTKETARLTSTTSTNLGHLYPAPPSPKPPKDITLRNFSSQATLETSDPLLTLTDDAVIRHEKNTTICARQFCASEKQGKKEQPKISQSVSTSAISSNIATTSQQPAVKEDLKKDVQNYLDKEKSEKMILINELLAGFKKNKTQKVKSVKAKAKPVATLTVGHDDTTHGATALVSQGTVDEAATSVSQAGTAELPAVKDSNIRTATYDTDDVTYTITVGFDSDENNSPANPEPNVVASVECMDGGPSEPTTTLEEKKTEGKEKAPEISVAQEDQPPTSISTLSEDSNIFERISALNKPPTVTVTSSIPTTVPPSEPEPVSDIPTRTASVTISTTSVSDNTETVDDLVQSSNTEVAKEHELENGNASQCEQSDKENIPIEKKPNGATEDGEMEVNILNVVSLSAQPPIAGPDAGHTSDSMTKTVTTSAVGRPHHDKFKDNSGGDEPDRSVRVKSQSVVTSLMPHPLMPAGDDVLVDAQRSSTPPLYPNISTMSCEIEDAKDKIDADVIISDEECETPPVTTKDACMPFIVDDDLEVDAIVVVNDGMEEGITTQDDATEAAEADKMFDQELKMMGATDAPSCENMPTLDDIKDIMDGDIWL